MITKNDFLDLLSSRRKGYSPPSQKYQNSCLPACLDFLRNKPDETYWQDEWDNFRKRIKNIPEGLNTKGNAPDAEEIKEFTDMYREQLNRDFPRSKFYPILGNTSEIKNEINEILNTYPIFIVAAASHAHILFTDVKRIFCPIYNNPEGNFITEKDEKITKPEVNEKHGKICFNDEDSPVIIGLNWDEPSCNESSCNIA